MEQDAASPLHRGHLTTKIAALHGSILELRSTTRHQHELVINPEAPGVGLGASTRLSGRCRFRVGAGRW